MKKIIFVSLIFMCSHLQAQINTLTPGQEAPEFELKNVNGKEVGFKNFPDAKGFILVFTCNTCPVSQAYEERIKELDKKYAAQGYPVIAINPNDPELVSDDSYEKMQQRAKNKAYSFPYLFDKGQVITNRYGAKNTPHAFLIGRQNKGYIIEYAGAIDNDPRDGNSGKTNYMENAIADLQHGKKPALASTKAIGCSVKRKTSDL